MSVLFNLRGSSNSETRTEFPTRSSVMPPSLGATNCKRPGGHIGDTSTGRHVTAYPRCRSTARSVMHACWGSYGCGTFACEFVLVTYREVPRGGSIISYSNEVALGLLMWAGPRRVPGRCGSRADFLQGFILHEMHPGRSFKGKRRSMVGGGQQSRESPLGCLYREMCVS